MEMRETMRAASSAVLDGFELGTDVQTVSSRSGTPMSAAK